MDHASNILDEIALEGLDGITLQGLWLRLSVRQDYICASYVKEDVRVQTALWMVVRRLRDVEFYCLGNPRKKLVITECYTVDNELGVITECTPVGENLYPYNLINVDGIVGSCCEYDQREDVSLVVRKLDLNVVVEKYGDRLVMVASQSVRSKTLLGTATNPNIDINPVEYCILERIGRSRYHGEPTRGKLSLSVLSIDPKTIYYWRKRLLKYNLIRKQMFQQKSNFAGILLHLPRFFKLIRPKYIELLESMLKIVKEEPRQFVEYDLLRKRVSSERKLARIMGFKKYFRTETKRYREVYPEAREEQWKVKTGDKEKVIRVVLLRNPNLEPGDIQKQFVGSVDEDDDDDDDDKSDVGILYDDNRLLDVSVMVQCCEVLKRHGGDGLTQVEIATRLGLQKVQARTTLKNCMKMGAIGMYLVDNGRQRSTKYYNKLDGYLVKDHVLIKSSESMVCVGGVKEMDSELDTSSSCVDTEGDVSKNITKRKRDCSISVNSTKKRKLVDENVEESNRDNDDIKLDSEVDVITSNVKVEILKEVECNGAEKNITVSITDDYSWLIPLTNEGKLAKLKEKSINTLRLLKRSNMIIEAVHELKVTDTRRLALLINRKEYEEGLSYTMDKKSLFRILYKLASSNYVKVFRVQLQNSVNVMEFNFVCDVSVSCDDHRIKSAIQFNKLKFHSTSTVKEAVPKMAPKVPQIKLKYDKRTSVSHIPKFNRMSILHKFLFYLVYDYNGSELSDQAAVGSKIMKQCGEDSLDALPVLYQATLDEKMFVPPLPTYDLQTKGWCLLSDVILRLPLSIFMGLVQIQYSIPEIDEYLKHPIKRYYLINSLPGNVRKCITATRKYVFSIFHDIVKLAYIGLVQFGAQQNKDKDQVFVFVNKRTMLVDTALTKPSYLTISPHIDYPVFNYEFDNLQNVFDYWHNCWKICMNTNLGMRSHLSDLDVFENVHEKGDMVNALKATDFLDAVGNDKGHVPGDKLGAAGFDSALFSHLKRNWFCKSILSTEYGSTKFLQSSGRVRKSLNFPNQTPKNLTMRPKSRGQDVGRFNRNTKEGECSKGVKNMNNNRGRIRKTKPNTRRLTALDKSIRRRPYYDPIDREALKHMRKLRVDWSPEEDRTLLICKIAASFLCSDRSKHMYANLFKLYREIIHKMYPQAKNKTSRACQRRVIYMLRSPDTLHNVQICVKELKLDDYIIKKYGNVFEVVREEAKRMKKNLKDMRCIWQDNFNSLVDELLRRYNNNNEFHNFALGVVFNKQHSWKNNIAIPGTLVEFYEHFDVQLVEKLNGKQKDLYGPVNNVNDIYSAVINSTIHSTLSCNNDTTSWSYHLFSIYQQYPETTLRNVLNRLRANQMVSYRKSYQVKTDKTLFMPLSASPYQLSITYVNLMQTRYQWNMFRECYKAYFDFVKTGVRRRKGSNDEVESGKYIEFLPVAGGHAAAIAELFNTGAVEFSVNIPKQIIMLDPNIKVKDESYSRLVKRYEDLLRYNNKDLTCSVLFEKSSDGDGLGKGDDDDVDGDESGDDGNNKHIMQNVAKASSRIALFMINEKFDSSNQISSVPKDVDHIYDFFLVNSCKVFGKYLRNVDNVGIISDSVVSSILVGVHNNAVLRSSEIVGNMDRRNDQDGENCYEIVEMDESVIEKKIEDNFNGVDVDLVKLILNKMKYKQEFGLTNEEIKVEFGNCIKIVNLMDKLTRTCLVLKTGVVYCRYVYYLYARPWLLCSFRNCQENDNKSASTSNTTHQITIDNELGDKIINVMDTEEKMDVSCSDSGNIKNHVMSEPIKVNIRPWIVVNGTINRRLLNDFLCSVLSHIMLHPGVSLLQVQERFAPAYLPQHTREACDMLIKLNCVTRYCVTVTSKPSLFSEPCKVTVIDCTGLENESTIRFETTIVAITNLGKFINSKTCVYDSTNTLVVS